MRRARQKAETFKQQAIREARKLAGADQIQAIRAAECDFHLALAAAAKETGITQTSGYLNAARS